MAGVILREYNSDIRVVFVTYIIVNIPQLLVAEKDSPMLWGFFSR